MTTIRHAMAAWASQPARLRRALLARLCVDASDSREIADGAIHPEERAEYMADERLTKTAIALLRAAQKPARKVRHR